VMRTDEGLHFSDEVFSWHNINGNDAELNALLPAILVTNRHPAQFKERALNHSHRSEVESNLKLILFPLKKYCESTGDVVELIQIIFSNIKQRKDLTDFGIVQEKKQGASGAVASSLIVEPTGTGTRLSFSVVEEYFMRK
jgi:hypothetical protein